MATPVTIKLVFSSEVGWVDLVQAAAERVAVVVGLGRSDALNLGLAVREAVINGIIHGNRSNPELQVAVTLTGSGSAVRARVLDQGVGFDVDAVPDPTDASNRLRTSGRGLLMMRAFVDRVSFRRPSRGGTEVTLIKNKSRKPRRNRRTE